MILALKLCFYLSFCISEPFFRSKRIKFLISCRWLLWWHWTTFVWICGWSWNSFWQTMWYESKQCQSMFHKWRDWCWTWSAKLFWWKTRQPRVKCWSSSMSLHKNDRLINFIKNIYFKRSQHAGAYTFGFFIHSNSPFSPFCDLFNLTHLFPTCVNLFILTHVFF